MLASSVNFKQRKFFANDNTAVRNIVEPGLENKNSAVSLYFLLSQLTSLWPPVKQKLINWIILPDVITDQFNEAKTARGGIENELYYLHFLA